MNNGSQGPQGQPGQGQPPGAQQRPPATRPFQPFRPEQMRTLPDFFSQEDKSKWENGLRRLWTEVETHGPETPEHMEGKKRLVEFSKTLTAKIRDAQARAAQQAAAGGSNSQNQSHPAQNHGGQSTAGASNPNAASQQAKPQPPKIPDKIMAHLNSFPWAVPPNILLGSNEAGRYLAEHRKKYAGALVTMDGAQTRVASLDQMIQKRNAEGNPLNPQQEKDFTEKREATKKAYSEAKAWVDKFRAEQERFASERAAGAGGSGSQPQNPSQQQPPTVGNGNPGQGPSRPQLTTQQQAPPNPAGQSTQQINAAIENARNQQMGGGRPPMQQNGGQNSQGPQMPAQQNAPSHPGMNPQGGQQQQASQPQNIKQESGVQPQSNPAPINHAINQIQQQGGQPRPGSMSSPQSAVPQSAVSQNGQQGPPRALTHQAALQTAARSYSSSGQNTGTPNVIGHSHSHSQISRGVDNQNVQSNKLPIPKFLPDRAVQPPQPVQMQQSRPTYSGGPSSTSNGVMGQPVLSKAPTGFQLEGDGNGVLTKQKLNELVRQVTSGGEGLEGGQGLTPEVEEVGSHLYSLVGCSQK